MYCRALAVCCTIDQAALYLGELLFFRAATLVWWNYFHSFVFFRFHSAMADDVWLSLFARRRTLDGGFGNRNGIVFFVVYPMEKKRP